MSQPEALILPAMALPLGHAAPTCSSMRPARSYRDSLRRRHLSQGPMKRLATSIRAHTSAETTVPLRHFVVVAVLQRPGRLPSPPRGPSSCRSSACLCNLSVLTLLAALTGLE